MEELGFISGVIVGMVLSVLCMGLAIAATKGAVKR